MKAKDWNFIEGFADHFTIDGYPLRVQHYKKLRKLKNRTRLINLCPYLVFNKENGEEFLLLQGQVSLEHRMLVYKSRYEDCQSTYIKFYSKLQRLMDEY